MTSRYLSYFWHISSYKDYIIVQFHKKSILSLWKGILLNPLPPTLWKFQLTFFNFFWCHRLPPPPPPSLHLPGNFNPFFGGIINSGIAHCFSISIYVKGGDCLRQLSPPLFTIFVRRIVHTTNEKEFYRTTRQMHVCLILNLFSSSLLLVQCNFLIGSCTSLNQTDTFMFLFDFYTLIVQISDTYLCFCFVWSWKMRLRSF